MLDKKKENLFEIPEPAEFATPKETKTDEPSSRSQLSLIRKMLLEKMGGKVPSHISTVEMFQRYLDDMDDGEE